MVHFPPRYQLSSDQSRSAVAPVCFPRKFMARWGKIVRIDALHTRQQPSSTLPCPVVIMQLGFGQKVLQSNANGYYTLHPLSAFKTGRF